MNTSPLASCWQPALAATSKLKKEGIEPSVLVADDVWAHYPCISLIIGCDYELFLDSADDEVCGIWHRIFVGMLSEAMRQVSYLIFTKKRKTLAFFG